MPQMRRDYTGPEHKAIVARSFAIKKGLCNGATPLPISMVILFILPPYQRVLLDGCRLQNQCSSGMLFLYSVHTKLASKYQPTFPSPIYSPQEKPGK